MFINLIQTSDVRSFFKEGRESEARRERKEAKSVFSGYGFMSKE